MNRLYDPYIYSMMISLRKITETMFPKDFDRHELGSCMAAAQHATEYLLKKRITDFKIVEGWVSLYPDQEEEDWSAHTWLEFPNGKKFDPTRKQWTQWGFDPEGVEYTDKIHKTYTPQEYLKVCKEEDLSENNIHKNITGYMGWAENLDIYGWPIYAPKDPMKEKHPSGGTHWADGWRYIAKTQTVWWNEGGAEEQQEALEEWLKKRRLEVKYHKALGYGNITREKDWREKLKEAMGDQPPTVSAIPHQPAQSSAVLSHQQIADAYVVVSTLYLEARGEGEKGMQAVMNVIMNRAKGDFSKAKDVVLKPKQFSCWNGISNPVQTTANMMKKERDGSLKDLKQYNQAIKIVDAAMKKKLTDITGGADHYYNPKKENPSWAKKMKRTIIVGDHHFHKSK